ncbi:phosphatase PAP2 family protein [Natronorubrum aibiense]|uniref:Phosphatase PAP2 family protein n=1 Tax=Natronorubrum aibiense TaxID=348826 RepID=A0A5P9P5G8_9EURY|nr:phosphatase PAP2 family protein [Natronorubrum aibiense]QFU83207.1 phosphatase PAP2 family protein [Natronorubrum aibiense]
MLSEVLTRVVLVVGFLLPISLGLFVGLERLAATRTEWRSRFRISGPAILIVSAVLLLNRTIRQDGTGFGIHMTSTIVRIEGEFVLIFQKIASPELTTYFSFIYVYGYTFLLVFPVVAYFALSDTKMFRRLLTAYAFNYALGLVLYALVIAYGPRNVFVDELIASASSGTGSSTILYDHTPEFKYLTREVNRNTNVFPSLHTSLSATVGIFAYLTRSSYPKWLPIAVVLAVSVIISTMYLGLHWGIDVLAGLVLAVLCVALSYRLVGRWSLSELSEQLSERLSDIDRDRF